MARIPISSFLKLIRIENLVIVLASQYLTAVFLIHPGEPSYQMLWNLELFSLVLSTNLVAAAGYIINDYYDIKIDLINKPGRVVVGKHIPRRKALTIHTILNFSGIFIGILISPVIGIIHLSSAFWLWIYSNQLKRLPLLGNAVISVLTGLTLMLIPVTFGGNYLLVASYAVLATAISMIRELIKDMEDVKGDSIFGANTFPVRHGLRKTKWLLYILMAGFLLLLSLLAIKLENQTFTYYLAALFVPSVYFAYRIVVADKARDYRFLSSFCKLLMISGILSMTFF